MPLRQSALEPTEGKERVADVLCSVAGVSRTGTRGPSVSGGAHQVTHQTRERGAVLPENNQEKKGAKFIFCLSGTWVSPASSIK